MDNEAFVKMVKLMASDSDSDAVLGLRGLQGLFREEGVDFAEVLKYAQGHLSAIKAANPKTIDQGEQKKGPAPVTLSGMPQTRVPKPGFVEMIPPGKTEGTIVQMPGAAAEAAENIAFNLKDALVASVLNKSRFKLKVVDIKNGRGDVIETVLQSEYEREGMAPVRIWSNLKGEVAALATVLRQAVKAAFPELTA